MLRPVRIMRDPDEEIAHAVGTIGDETIARRLVGAYGTAWHGVWSLTEADPALAGFLQPGFPYVYAELLHAITHEQAATLGDLLIRRTPIALTARAISSSGSRMSPPASASVAVRDGDGAFPSARSATSTTSAAIAR